jgi:hypothetical protein
MAIYFFYFYTLYKQKSTVIHKRGDVLKRRIVKWQISELIVWQ